MIAGVPQVAIIEPAAAYRRGLAGALAGAGYEVVEPADPSAWAARGTGAGAVVGFNRAEDEDLIGSLARAVTVIALVSGSEPWRWWQAMAAGAGGVADRDAPPETIVDVVDHALAETSVLPGLIIRWLIERVPLPGKEEHEVTREEAGWLRSLAAGRTVADLADEIGYSERTLFRRLHYVYGRLGASNRVEALLAARRIGLLDD